MKVLFAAADSRDWIKMIQEGKKWCRRCSAWISVSEFTKNSQAPDGLFHCCRSCAKIKRDERREINRKNYAPPPDGFTRLCPGCKKVKPAAEFSKCAQSVNGLQTRCKVCRERRNRAVRYGLTEESYLSAIRKQNYQCAICGCDTRLLGRNNHIDHCHITGRFRAILCFRCNAGLGSFRDNPELLEAAVRYIRGHRDRQVTG